MALALVSSAVVVNDTSNSTGAALTGNFTAAGGTDHVLLAGVTAYAASDIQTPTFGSAAMTLVAVRNYDGSTNRRGRTWVYALASPSGGSTAFSVTTGDTDHRALIATLVEYSGWDGVLPLEAHGDAGGSATRSASTVSETVTTANDNSAILLFGGANKQTSATPADGATELSDAATGTAAYSDCGQFVGAKTLAAAGSTAIGYTSDNADWQSDVWCVLSPAAGAGGQTLTPSLLTGGTIYSPTVFPGAVFISPPRIAAAAIHPPAVSLAGAGQGLEPPLVTGGAVYAPSAVAGAVVLAPPLVTGGDIHPPAVSGFYALSAPSPPAGAIYAPTVIPGQATIAPPLLASGAIYLPILSGGERAVPYNIFDVAGARPAAQFVSGGGEPGYDLIGVKPPSYSI